MSLLVGCMARRIATIFLLTILAAASRQELLAQSAAQPRFIADLVAKAKPRR